MSSELGTFGCFSTLLLPGFSLKEATNMANISLTRLTDDDREQFILDNQRAFKYGLYPPKGQGRRAPARRLSGLFSYYGRLRGAERF